DFSGHVGYFIGAATIFHGQRFNLRATAAHGHAAHVPHCGLAVVAAATAAAGIITPAAATAATGITATIIAAAAKLHVAINTVGVIRDGGVFQEGGKDAVEESAGAGHGLPERVDHFILYAL